MSTILLADDNPHARRMGIEILGDEGHEVVAVEDGSQAVEYLNANRPDLVLADTEMPGASGYDLCGYVRSQPRLEGVRVVLLQPPLERFDEQRAAEVGSDGVLHKPLDATTLIATVASLLSENGQPVKEETVPEAMSSESEEPDEDPQPVEDEHETADPFAAAVEEALSGPRTDSELRDEVRSAVAEVINAAAPALIDRITERVLESIRKK